MHHLYIENEKRLLRLLYRDVKKKMEERKDYQAYYYRPVTSKYLKVSKEAADFLEGVWGNN